MRKLLLIIATVLATASCGESKSDTLGEFGHYRNVRGAWQERTDTLDGPGKFLAYDIWSDDKRATLSLGCFNNGFTTAVSINGAGAAVIDRPAVVALDRDGAKASERFAVLRGDTDLRPGHGTSDDAYRFITSLKGKHRLGFKLRSVMGRATRDQPLGFDVNGVERVARNLEVACHKAT